MMISEENMNMAEAVLAKVKAGECKRRPKWYFMVHALLWGALALSLAACAALVASFLFFTETVSGEQHLLSFGWRGAMAFVTILPWTLILIEVVLLVALEMVARKSSIGYRTPILYLFGGIVAFGVFVAALINVTPIHTSLLERADHKDLPVVGDLYEAIHDSHESEGVFRGVVVSVGSSSLVIAHNDLDNDTDDGVKIVTFPMGTRADAFKAGDRIIVAGDATDTVIRAYGIERW